MAKFQLELTFSEFQPSGFMYGCMFYDQAVCKMNKQRLLQGWRPGGGK